MSTQDSPAPPTGDTLNPSKSAIKKEAKRLNKEAKVKAKTAKVSNATPTDGKKGKVEKGEEEAAFVNTVPKGEKKDVSQRMPVASGYNPIVIEAAWYDWWSEQGFFKPQMTADGKPKPEGSFVISSPPPEVAGSLHIGYGYALTVVIQDSLIRWNRMLGKTTQFVPGLDNAGIFTQSVIEKRSYEATGREQFLKPDYQSEIIQQLHILGCSYDWSRTVFTMDPNQTKAVVETFCYAMIRDTHSHKSLGSVVDPIDIIQGLPLEELHERLSQENLDEKEFAKAKAGQKKVFPKGVPQCGSDALRFALCAHTFGGGDINLEILRVKGYRKFCNKVFNATKFAMFKLDEEFVPTAVVKPTVNESLIEQWILHKMNIAAEEVNRQLTKRDFMMATNAVYKFWLYELCDVYIEAIKPMMIGDSAIAKRSTQQTLYTCLDYGLRLLHPFMPFVTEELWQRLPRIPNDTTPSIMISSYPIFDKDFVLDNADKNFDLIFSTIRTGRSLASSYGLQTGFQLFIQVKSEQEAALFESQASTIRTLTKGCKSVKVIRDIQHIPAGCISSLPIQSIVVHILV